MLFWNLGNRGEIGMGEAWSDSSKENSGKGLEYIGIAPHQETPVLLAHVGEQDYYSRTPPGRQTALRKFLWVPVVCRACCYVPEAVSEWGVAWGKYWADTLPRGQGLGQTSCRQRKETDAQRESPQVFFWGLPSWVGSGQRRALAFKEGVETLSGKEGKLGSIWGNSNTLNCLIQTSWKEGASPPLCVYVCVLFIGIGGIHSAIIHSFHPIERVKFKYPKCLPDAGKL